MLFIRDITDNQTERLQTSKKEKIFWKNTDQKKLLWQY